LGAYGNTIDWGTTLNTRQGDDAAMVQLVKDMNDGAVGALFIHGVNPVYDYFDAKKFESGLAKVAVSVSFNDREDETSVLCKYQIADHHFLESWGDAEMKSGYVSFIQPTIAPLFKTRAFQTSLLKWSGNDASYGDYFKQYWNGKFGSQSAWDKALRDGIVETPAAASAGSYSGAAFASAASGVTAGKKQWQRNCTLFKSCIGCWQGSKQSMVTGNARSDYEGNMGQLRCNIFCNCKRVGH